MTIILEEVDGALVGRTCVGETKTSAFIISMKDNYRLFNTEQLTLINNQIF